MSEEQKLIYNDLKGPSWSPSKKNKKIVLEFPKIINDDENEKGQNINIESAQQGTKDSVRAIMLIRAYRIRGHLIASLDPLSLLAKTEEHPRTKARNLWLYKKQIIQEKFF